MFTQFNLEHILFTKCKQTNFEMIKLFNNKTFNDNGNIIETIEYIINNNEHFNNDICLVDPKSFCTINIYIKSAKTPTYLIAFDMIKIFHLIDFTTTISQPLVEVVDKQLIAKTLLNHTEYMVWREDLKCLVPKTYAVNVGDNKGFGIWFKTYKLNKHNFNQYKNKFKYLHLNC